jgi:pentatricopeptide repeat protein
VNERLKEAKEYHMDAYTDLISILFHEGNVDAAYEVIEEARAKSPQYQFDGLQSQAAEEGITNEE